METTSLWDKRKNALIKEILDTEHLSEPIVALGVLQGGGTFFLANFLQSINLFSREFCMNHFGHFKKMLFSYPDCKETIANSIRVVLIGNDMTSIFGRKPDLFVPIQVDQMETYLQVTFLNDKIGEFLNKDSTAYVCNTLQSRLVASCLKKYGVTKCIDITHCNHRFTSIVDADLLKAHLPEIEWLFSVLEDDDSKRIALSLLLFRITKDPTRIPSSPYTQYLHPKIKLYENDVIIDGGAFEGDSAFMFLHKIGAKAKIYSFEPQENNYEELLKNINRYKFDNCIIPIRRGLWSSSGNLSFVEASNSSHIIEGGPASIPVVSIDDFFDGKGKIDVIKLDVEGAEVEVLNGARRTISTSRPLMILCVYHRGDHIWSIPKIIENEYGNYKFYLGHHSPDLTVYETVLYAIPNEIEK